MSAFSLYTDFSDEELPPYQEIEQSPDVVVEEREIVPSDDEDDYEEEEQKSVPKQSSITTFTSLKSVISGDVQKPNARVVLEQSVTSISVKGGLSERRPLAKPLSIQTSPPKSRKTAFRAAPRLNNSI